jgi:hypothetical protein
MKCCKECQIEKPLSEFKLVVERKPGKPECSYYQGKCKSCAQRYMRDWSRERRKPVTIERKRAYRRKTIYGLTDAEFQALFDAQQGVCAVCREPEATTDRLGNVRVLCVDHCHTSKRVRGLLCYKCNVGLGSFKDDPKRLAMASEYLSRTGH